MSNAMIRPMEPSDYNFVINSWLKSYRTGSYFTKRIRDEIYYKYHHIACTRILTRDQVSILIACDPEDPRVIFGYLVFEMYEGKPLIHYIYVKNAFRQMRIAKDLVLAGQINPEGALFTHWTRPMDEVIKKYQNLIYCPYLI